MRIVLQHAGAEIVKVLADTTADQVLASFVAQYGAQYGYRQEPVRDPANFEKILVAAETPFEFWARVEFSWLQETLQERLEASVRLKHQQAMALELAGTRLEIGL